MLGHDEPRDWGIDMRFLARIEDWYAIFARIEDWFDCHGINIKKQEKFSANRKL